MSTFDVTLRHPFSCVISGGSGSGKTVWVNKLLLNRQQIFTPRVNIVYYYYTEYQNDLFENMLKSNCVQKFIQGMPTTDDIKLLTEDKDHNVLIVIDDNMKNINQDLSEIFTTFRHRNVSILFLTQNLFLQNKDYRTMSLNSNYIIIMKNPRDQSQIISFAKQFKPYNTKYVVDAFHFLTKNKPYSYALFDLKQETNECLRMRTNIFPDEWPMTVFMQSM